MHGEKRDVEPDEEQPEMYLPEHSIQKSPGHLREPVIQTAEHGKERASDQDIVKVRHQEIGIMYLQIDRYRSQHHSRESTNKKFKEETKDPEHGQLHLQLAMPNSGQPAEKLHSGGNYNHQSGGREKTFTEKWQSGRKHVVNPHTESEKAGGHHRNHDWRIAKNVAAGQ